MVEVKVTVILYCPRITTDIYLVFSAQSHKISKLPIYVIIYNINNLELTIYFLPENDGLSDSVAQ